MTATARVNKQSLTPDELMTQVTDEYDRCQSKSKKSTSSNDDAAYSATSSNKKKFSRTCFNCGKPGHRSRDCTAEGGRKAGQNSKGRGDKGKGKEKAAAASAEKDDEPDVIWLTYANEGWEEQSDWFSEMDENDTPLVEELGNENDSGAPYPISYNSALFVSETGGVAKHTILFDSGATCHMLSFKDQFINFKSIPPKAITAADKCTFQALGKGDLPISIPNGKATTCVLLKDVLYAPQMGVTIISISRLDATGFATIFRDS